ncbi:MAG: glycosyltransferase family 4 protein [Bdellovibrionota bacterium]
MSLRICLVSSRFNVQSRASDRGALWPLARGLARRGHEVFALSSRSPLGLPLVQRDGVSAYYVEEGKSTGSFSTLNDRLYQQFEKLHSQKKFDIVHGLDASAYRIARAKKTLKVKVAMDVEATQMSQVLSILGMQQETVGSLLTTGIAVSYKFLTTYFGRDRKLLRSTDGVFVTSPLQRVLLERYYLYPDQHIFTVPYGLEMSPQPAQVNPEQVRTELGLPDKSQLTVTLSDMTELAELTHLLSAFEKVAIKKPQSFLLVIGNGPLFKQVEYEILNRALGSRVLLLGSLKDEEVQKYLRASDIFINLSSRTTGFEPSLLEAMANKKVIIGSEIGPLSHVIEDGMDGFLLRPADIESLTQLWLEIFSGSLGIQEMGERAQTKVKHLFDPEKMLDSLIQSYGKILVKSDNYASR